MIITSIGLKDVETLESIFAYLTIFGWVVPDWLVVLRKAVEEREYETLEIY